MSVHALAPVHPVLADRIPTFVARDAALVTGGALLTAAAAQMVVPLPFTPVPLSGQTFGVLLVGAALGPVRGAFSMTFYLLLGMAGLPFYAQGASGVQTLLGPTGGYLVGFVVAAMLIGHLARRGLDRTVGGTVLSFVAGSVAIYVLGVAGLMLATGVGLTAAIGLGVLPFLVGDVLKAVIAGLILPSAWRVAGDRS